MCVLGGACQTLSCTVDNLVIRYVCVIIEYASLFVTWQMFQPGKMHLFVSLLGSICLKLPSFRLGFRQNKTLLLLRQLFIAKLIYFDVYGVLLQQVACCMQQSSLVDKDMHLGSEGSV